MTSPKIAIVVGSRGQDGTILCGRLKELGYQIIEVAKETPDANVADSTYVGRLVRETTPHEIYYLAAHHHSSEEKISHQADLFKESLNVNILGLEHFLRAVRLLSPKTRLFYAGSSHVFGVPITSPQDESTPFNPINVYGITKAAGINVCNYYRRQFGVSVSCGILFNHESILRNPKFISRKLARAAAMAKSGIINSIAVGNLNARVDWGYAPDYVDAMIRILGAAEPDDFVIASGVSHSVAELADKAFSRVGLDYREHVIEDGNLLGTPSVTLVGDSSKLARVTGWKPTKTFDELVAELVDYELSVNSEI